MRNATKIKAVMFLGLFALAGCTGSETSGETEYTETLERTYRGGFTDRTRGDMNSIGAALAQYMADAGAYPVVGDITALATALEPRYSRSVPRTDAWDRPYRYTSDGSGFTLTSDGPDGAAGGGDDIVLTDGGFR